MLHSHTKIASAVIALSMLAPLRAQPARPHLEIKLDKKRYKVGEPIHVVMTWRNPTNYSLQVDGILPPRQSANPPSITITTQSGLRFSPKGQAGIPVILMNDVPIKLSPYSSIVIFDSEITRMRMWSPSGANSKQSLDFTHLPIGHYKISGDFSASGYTGETWQAHFVTIIPAELEIE